jgi:hypothetical protein
MLKVKRTVKHGDHDQSEHGAWASGGGSGDKETSDREKTGDEKGVNGYTNRPTYNMALMADGSFEDDAKQALEDSDGDVQEAGRALGHTMLNATEEDFDANGLNSELANGLISGVVERMDWDAIADNYIAEVGGESTWKGSDSFRSGDEEEHNGWTNRATWLGSLHIDNSGVMGGSDSIRDIAKEAFDAAGGDSEKARYELGRTLASNIQDELEMSAGETNGGSSNVFLQDLLGEATSSINWNEIGENIVSGFAEPKKSFRVKRSVKHGDHDQADHAPGGAGTGAEASDKEDEDEEDEQEPQVENPLMDDATYHENENVSQETQDEAKAFAEELKDLDHGFSEGTIAAVHTLTVGGEEKIVAEFYDEGQAYYITQEHYDGGIAGVPGPDDAFITLTGDETYEMESSQELKDYLAANISGAPKEEVAAAYNKLIVKADQNYKEANDTDEGVLGLD